MSLSSVAGGSLLGPRTQVRQKPFTDCSNKNRPQQHIALQHTVRLAIQERRSYTCQAAKGALDDLKKVRSGITIDPAYANGAAYLKTIGFNNTGEIAKILDIAMNPNSLFMDYGGKRSKNAEARSLDVETDMKPVIEFLISRGTDVGEVCKIISGHPPILSYSVKDRLEPFWDYLTSLGVKDVNAAVVGRPSLLGLHVDQNLRKIVNYLESVDTPPETIIKYLLTSI